MEDNDITKNCGVYEYLLYGQEKHLRIRAFTPIMAAPPLNGKRVCAPRVGSNAKLRKCKQTTYPMEQGGKNRHGELPNALCGV